MKIHKAIQSDALKLAKLHKKSLINSYVSKLPIVFIRLFYLNLIKNQNFEVLIVKKKSVLCGALVLSKSGPFKSQYLIPPIYYAYLIQQSFLSYYRNNFHKPKTNKYPIIKSSYNIEFLYIDKSFRSYGIGSLMLEYCKKISKNLTVCTRAINQNRAIDFYKTNGFKKTYNFIKFGKNFFLMSLK